MSDWETLRRQVAVCGRVWDARGRPAADVPVYIESASAAGRSEPTRSKADGLFWFMDLPAGEYRLGAGAPPEVGGGTAVSVVWDEAGNIKRVVADLRLAGDRRPKALRAMARLRA
jgi:hypothetical protein